MAHRAAAAAPSHDDELQKKSLSMLWNLTISSHGIGALVRHQGVTVVLEVMRAYSLGEEVQQNALGVLRNISDAPEGQAVIMRASGLPLLIETIRRYEASDEVVELCVETLSNVCDAQPANAIGMLLEGAVEALSLPRIAPRPSAPPPPRLLPVRLVGPLRDPATRDDHLGRGGGVDPNWAHTLAGSTGRYRGRRQRNRRWRGAAVACEPARRSRRRAQSLPARARRALALLPPQSNSRRWRRRQRPPAAGGRAVAEMMDAMNALNAACAASQPN